MNYKHHFFNTIEEQMRLSGGVCLFGASGHSRELKRMIKAQYPTTSTITVTPTGKEEAEGGRIVSEDSFLDIVTSVPEGYRYSTKFKVFLGIGSPTIREKIFNKLSNLDLIEYPPLLSRYALFSGSFTKLSPGLVVAPGVVVTDNVTVGIHVHLNTSSTICHDVSVGDFSIVSPGAVLCGNVSIGKKCYIGAGAVIKDGVTICDNVTVGAGSLVLKDITSPGTYVGSPAKFLKEGSL